MFSYVDHSVKSSDLCDYAGVPVESRKRESCHWWEGEEGPSRRTVEYRDYKGEVGRFKWGERGSVGQRRRGMDN